MPRVPTETRAQLASALTRAFCDSAGIPDEIFGVRFFFYEWGEAASGSKLCQAGDEGRPYLHALLYTPRLARDTKRKVVRALSEAFPIATGESGWIPVIHLCEHPYENVGVEGELLTDRYPELAERSFYYELPD